MSCSATQSNYPKLNWLSEPVPVGESCQVQLRYRSRAVTATVIAREDDRIRLVLETPIRAITPGQSGVLYSPEGRVLGRGGDRLRLRSLLLLAAVLPGQLHAQSKKPLTIDQFVSMPTVGDPQLSPDGKLVAYTISTPSLEDNRSTSRIWLADACHRRDLAGDDRRRQRPGASLVTRRANPGIHFHPGGRLADLALPARGGEPTKLTSFADGVGDFLWSPDGKGLLFWTSVKWPDSTEAEKRGGKYPTEAKIWTDLFYRHWDEWRVGLRQHVFRVSLPDGAVTDLTPIDRDVPTLALGGADVAISPVATEVAVVFNPDSNLASTTNNDIFVMGPDGSSRQGITNSAANDNSPLYSPDSRYIAYLAMSTARLRGRPAAAHGLRARNRASGSGDGKVGSQHPGFPVAAGFSCRDRRGRGAWLATICTGSRSREAVRLGWSPAGSTPRCRSRSEASRWCSCASPQRIPRRFSSPGWTGSG
jgi:hypothetical protein